MLLLILFLFLFFAAAIAERVVAVASDPRQIVVARALDIVVIPAQLRLVSQPKN
ncbi:MAG: hypothetical protein ACM3TN_02120 [Alphaproteobacteria bacterium]